MILAVTTFEDENTKDSLAMSDTLKSSISYILSALSYDQRASLGFQPTEIVMGCVYNETICDFE